MDAQSLGRYLRQAREMKELTLEDAEAELRIRRRILEQFELGDFNIVDASPVQLRGFIRNYAQYLGLDDAVVMGYFDDAMTGGANRTSLLSRSRTKKKPNKRDSATTTASVPVVPISPRVLQDASARPSSMPSTHVSDNEGGISAFGWLLRGGVALIALGVIAFVVLQMTQEDSLLGNGDDSTFGNSILGGIPTSVVSPAPSFTAAIVPTVGITEVAILNTGFEGVSIQIEMSQRAWLNVVVDGVNVFTGLSQIGDVHDFLGASSVVVTSTNAEALNIIFNGQIQNTFGGRGQRVDLTFSPNGVQVQTGAGFAPTPEISDTPIPTPTDLGGALIAQLTPTDTPGPSPTPTETPTETLTPTDTPIPSDTPTETYTPSITPTPSDTPTATSTPTSTFTPTATLTASNTPTATLTPSETATPTATLTPSPTAILPPRVTPADVTPPK